MQLATMNAGNSSRRPAFVWMGILAGAVTSAMLVAQTSPPGAEPAMHLAATSVNVNGAGESVDLYILNWSTDADRDRLSTAWSQPNAGVAAVGGRGRGGGRGGAGESEEPPPPRTPERALTDTLKELPRAGHFWTSEVAGYLIRYAYRTPAADGGSRIILLTDKRLGVSKNNWQSPGFTPNDYEFSLIELRLPASGEGEGKTSLTGRVDIDPDTGTLALADYDSLPVVMEVRLR